MRTTIHTQYLSLVIVCLCAACASAGGEGVQAPQFGTAGEVEVVNDGHSDFLLFMVRDGERFRLGRVSRMETARFRIPPPRHGASYQVSLVAVPSGSDAAFATIPITWHPGQNLRGRVGRTSSTQDFVLVTR
jgi:hypothetical protein